MSVRELAGANLHGETGWKPCLELGAQGHQGEGPAQKEQEVILAQGWSSPDEEEIRLGAKPNLTPESGLGLKQGGRVESCRCDV